MNISERALQIWQVLIGLAHNRQTMTYGQLAKLIGMGSNTLAQPLGNVMEFCERNDFPPLTVLIVNQKTGQPGVGLTTLEDLNKDRERVFNFEWYKLKPIKI